MYVDIDTSCTAHNFFLLRSNADGYSKDSQSLKPPDEVGPCHQ